MVSLPGRWVCESWNTHAQQSVDYYACVIVTCPQSLSLGVRTLPGYLPFPSRQTHPWPGFTSGLRGPHPGPDSYPDKKCKQPSWLEHSLCRKVQELICVPNFLPRWCHSSCSFCRLISDVIWTFMIFSFWAHQCPVFLSLISTHCLFSPVYLLWPSSLMEGPIRPLHDPRLLTVASPGPAHSLIIPFILDFQSCLRFPIPGSFSAIYPLSLRDWVQGKNKTQLRELERSKQRRMKASKIHFVNIFFTEQVHFARLKISFKKLINSW